MLTFLRKNKITLVLIAVLICLLSLAFVLSKNDNSAEVKADNTCDSVLSGGSSYSFNNDGIYFNYSHLICLDFIRFI